MNSNASIIRSLVCVITAQQLTSCEAVSSAASHHPYGAAAIGAAALIGGILIADHEIDSHRRRSELETQTSYHLNRYDHAIADSDELKQEVISIRASTENLLTDVNQLKSDQDNLIITRDAYESKLNSLSLRKKELMSEIDSLRAINADRLASIRIDQLAEESAYSTSTDGQTVLNDLYESLTSPAPMFHGADSAIETGGEQCFLPGC